MEAGSSLAAFVSGLLLASVFGGVALFLQKQPPWSCACTTLAVAVPAAFGMGLSAGVRADVSVLLPTMCSGRSAGHL